MSIHDQNYVRYEGTITPNKIWWTIATTSFRTYIKFTRTKLILAFLWLAPIIASVLIFAEYGVRNAMGGIGGGMVEKLQAPTGEYISFYLQVITFSLAILFMAAGAGVIADDLRYKTFQLYFSKPLSKLDYILGKFLGVFLLGAIVSIIPLFLLGGLRIALYARTPFFKEVGVDVAMGGVLSFGITILISAIILGLSSLTSRKGYVVLSWIGVLVVPLILNGIATIATEGADFAGLLSLTGNINILSDWLLTESQLEGVLIFSPFILITLALAGFGAVFWRVSKLEGVA